MTPATNLIAMALVLGSTDVAVEPKHLPIDWQKKAWRMLLEGAGHVELMETLNHLQCSELSDAMAALPPYKQEGQLISYARLVVEEAIDWDIKHSMDMLATKFHGSDLAEQMLRKLTQTTREAPREVFTIPAKEVAGQLIEAAEEAYRGITEQGIPTGIRALDSMLTFGGLKRGAITVLAGASSSGKSALAKTCVLGALESGSKVLWGTFEDSSRSAVTRMVSDLSGIQNRQLQRSVVGKEEWKYFSQAVSTVANSDLWFIDQQPGNIDKLIDILHSEVDKLDIDLLVIDYLQLLNPGRAESKIVGIGNIATKLQIMAKAMPNTAVLEVNQLKRTQNQCPTKEDLRWSGEIEQTAHTIGLLWRPELEEDFPMVAFNLDKQKDGPTGLLALGWNPETVSYADPDVYIAQDYLAAARKAK